METILILKGVIITVFIIFYLYLGIKASEDCTEDHQGYKEGKRKFVVVANFCQRVIMTAFWLPWAITAYIFFVVIKSCSSMEFSFGDFIGLTPNDLRL